MIEEPSLHPTPCEIIRNDLALFARGLLEESDREAVSRHVKSCAACAADVAFSFELEQVVRLEASEAQEPPLGPEFTRRVMAAVGAPAAPRAVRPVLAMRRTWVALAAAASLLLVITLALRTPVVPPNVARVARHEPVPVEPVQGVLVAQLKDALYRCGLPSNQVAGERFPEFAPERAVNPANDPFYLNDPYAALWSPGVLPRWQSIDS